MQVAAPVLTDASRHSKDSYVEVPLVPGICRHQRHPLRQAGVDSDRAVKQILSERGVHESERASISLLCTLLSHERAVNDTVESRDSSLRAVKDTLIW